MQIDNVTSDAGSVGPLARFGQGDVAARSGDVPDQDSDSFSTWLTSEIGAVNNQIHASESLVQQLAVGETDNLHQVMIALEKTKLQFELIVQVRNKLLESYQEIMRMQV